MKKSNTKKNIYMTPYKNAKARAWKNYIATRSNYTKMFTLNIEVSSES